MIKNKLDIIKNLKKFELSKKFIEKYEHRKPKFGFNGLGELVYMRTYSRIKSDGKNEQWFETVERVVNGAYNIQRKWIEEHGLGWDSPRAQRSAQEMYDRMYNFKFLPSGRSLFILGANTLEEKRTYAALNSCSFVSTENLKEDLTKPFCFLMDMSMLGSGCGFDTKGTSTIIVKGPNKSRSTELFIIPDSREGWVESVKMLIESYFLGTAPIEFDYTQIRVAGILIKGFGGISSGSEPLKKLHNDIRFILGKETALPISITTIVDIQNAIGRCVISGNVRRTAEIVFGDPESDEYLDLKNYEINPQRQEWGWASNNSIFAKLGMNYSKVCERTRINGEPGFAWLENMQNYSRMTDTPDYKDSRVRGGNPYIECGIY